MTKRQLENRVKELKEIESTQKALEAEAEKIKAEIKQAMEESGADEMQAGNWLVRFKRVIGSRFNAKAFAEDHPNLYRQYMVPSQTMRFTII